MVENLLILAFSICLGCYFILFHSIRKRLAKLFPRQLDSQVEKTSDPILKKVYGKTGWGFSLSFTGVHHFVMMKIYLDAGDEILIRKGSQARTAFKAFYFLVLLYCCWFVYKRFLG